MNWIAFDDVLLNPDHVISIDRVGSKSLDVYIARSPNLESKRISFDTEEDRNAAFDRIKAFVTGEGNEA